MTDDEWLRPAASTTDIERKATGLGDRPTPRQFALFRLACCQNLRPLVSDPRLVESMNIAEQFVEGEANDRAMAQAFEQINSACDLAQNQMVAGMTPASQGRFWMVLAIRNAVHAAWNAQSVHRFDDANSYSVVTQVATAITWNQILPTCWPEGSPRPTVAWTAEYARVQGAEIRWQDALLRDLCGGPSRLSLPEPGWLESQGKLNQSAASIYREQRFAELATLADALEQGGCTEVAAHFRTPGPHTRGCWALDWLLGKG